jgi:Fe2+ or Zn2+ uptake regulation protein
MQAGEQPSLDVHPGVNRASNHMDAGHLAGALRASGRKVTPQRLAVISALSGDEAHPTAEIVWHRVRSNLPTVSLRTVYQALNDLVELGEIQSVDVGAGPVRFDPNTAAHDHFVCTECGRVADVRASAPVRLSAPDFPGYEVMDADIVFRGRCPRCATTALEPSR